MAVYGNGPIGFESVSSVTATPTPGLDLGTEVMYAGVKYRYVYLDGDTQALPGMGVTVSGLSGYSVTISSVTDINDICLGVVVHSTLTTATYGWVAIQGFVDCRAIPETAVTTGDPITLAGNGRFKTASALTAVADIDPWVMGQAVETTAASGVFKAYIRCY